MTDSLPVYKKDANGQLIRIPHDIRDPKRRYAMVSDATGSYHREFTDDEEKQRDAEEAKWEAERPQREKESAIQKDTFEKFKNSLVYEDRIVAFLDILGWGSKIEESVHDPELTKKLGITLNGISGYADFVDSTRTIGLPYDMRVTQLSDAIVLSAAHNVADDQFMMGLHDITHICLNMGMLVRGGVAYGKLIHKGSNVYGKALIEAYKLERDKAKFPRIIIDPMLEKNWAINPQVLHQDGTLIGYRKIWRKDEDECIFYDFLQPHFGMPLIESDSISSSDLYMLNSYRKLIIEGLEKYRNDKNDNILQKYKWGAKYFNTMMNEYPQINLKKIEVI